MDRPYVICHMTMSVDGKVTGTFLESADSQKGIEEYYRINRQFKADAFACGRVTMEGSFTGGFVPDLTMFEDAKVDREDHIFSGEAKLYAVSFDRHGKLGWTAPCIEDEDPGYGESHIIQVLCEDTSDAYLSYLKSISVSYIFAGKSEMDIPLALGKLRRLFGIKTLLLEGGSILNGAFNRDGVIDELSLVVVPVSGEADDKPLFYDGNVSRYCLKDIQRLEGGAVWLRYNKG